MRFLAPLLAASLTVPLFPAAAPPGQVSLGIGALDSNSIVVRIDGKEQAVTLANTKSGSAPATAFLRCLVAGRVVRIKGPHSAATALLLDDTSIADHVNEFLQSKTGMDPCELGKAAYRGHK
jgi:hypothetical protein